MIIDYLVALLILACTEPAAKPVQPAQQASVDFAKDVRPIFERNCMPCHFEGGKMYAKLPFDQPQTITKLGTKVFSRIRNEDDRAVIRRFLAAK